MILAVADTHAPIWYAFDDPRLSTTARHWIEMAEVDDHRIAVSSMSLIEIAYLVEKGRVDPRTLERVEDLLIDGRLFFEVPVTRRIAKSMRSIPRHEVPDMPDRIIAATAVHLGVPLISRDGKIRASSVTTIW